jgi:flagellar biosynthesis/type III secretory pathway protein FliH
VNDSTENTNSPQPNASTYSPHATAETDAKVYISAKRKRRSGARSSGANKRTATKRNRRGKKKRGSRNRRLRRSAQQDMQTMQAQRISNIITWPSDEEAYKEGFNSAYNQGFNAGFAEGLEVGKQIMRS